MGAVIYLTIYIGSAIAWYYSVKYMFNNQFKTINPGWFEVLITFVPLINTIWAVLNWAIILGERKSNKRKNVAIKFFGIKRT